MGEEERGDARMTTKQAMSVEELIAALQRVPGDAVVLVDLENYPWVTGLTQDADSHRDPKHVLLTVPPPAVTDDTDGRIRAAAPELLGLVEFARDHIENAPYRDAEAERWIADADTLIRHCRHGHAKWPGTARYIQ
jgi:hypothetical protein